MATKLMRSHKELATRLYTAVVSDALDAFGSSEQLLASRIRPVGRLMHPLIGRAGMPRAVEVDASPMRSYSTWLESMDHLAPGQAWVFATDNDGQVRAAVLGGLLATAARARWTIGYIADGAVPDSNALERRQFSSFATRFCPVDSFGGDEVVEHGEPIRCGGVTTCPADLAVDDHDGIVVVPAAREAEVDEYALSKMQGEGEMRKELAAGLSAAEAFARYGIL